MAEISNGAYDPKQVEDRIYRSWEESGFFNPDRLPPVSADQRGSKRGSVQKKSTPIPSPLSPKPFVIIMPPPNANGALHIGHAVFVTLQDIMIRFRRMQGRKTLWLPGADHAGFETQVVFDKKLEKEGRNRFQIPRDQLFREMLDFTMANKAVMEGQLRKLGASCDWSREKFTLDPDIAAIVTDTFVRLYEDGLLYRSERIVNWCVKHQTALSDLEVRHEERSDPLYYIRYGPLTLATVRPETKFGDTAVAVHPKDKRYRAYVGTEIEIETLIGPAKIEVIADEAVDPEFGTGVIKVTPAHDPADFEIGKRHKLEVRPVIDRNGCLNEKTGPYAGLKVAEARAKVATDMETRGLMVKVEPGYKHNVAVCYKCGSILEPLVMPQWFIAMTKPVRRKQETGNGEQGGKSLRDRAVEAVKSREITFYPERAKKTFFHWMQNLRDWNISRQITWGIRIPAWYDITDAQNKSGGMILKRDSLIISKGNRDRIHAICGGHGPTGSVYKDGSISVYVMRFNIAVVIVEELKLLSWSGLIEKIEQFQLDSCKEYVSHTKPKGLHWIQDPDVLDTWFSSGQWPFATLMTSDHQSRSNAKCKMQNAKSRNDFETFYPTDVMETGYDILFFWVARMIMFGLYRTGKVPFKTVYLHGLVRDKDRQKMSKSKGNVIDPLGVAGEYGTDAVRMALTVGNLPGNDIIISEEKIRGYRNFANKIWNIHRFIVTRYEQTKGERRKTKAPVYSIEDKKRLKELTALVKKVTRHLEKFEFHHAAEAIYHYTWHTFADTIIEEAKPRLASADAKERARAFSLLVEIHATLLKLLHPFMPFITEELWGHMPNAEGQKTKDRRLLMVEQWPTE